MDLEVLEFVLDNGHENFINAIKNSHSNYEVASSVGEMLLASKGDVSKLKGNQIYVYEKCIAPIFKVPCEGIYGKGTCTGNRFVDDESLSMSYQEDDFLCQHCRNDREQHKDV